VINIHGGAFMLGSSKMVNKDQIQDCLDRGWVVVAANHRLCPQVDLLQGPIADCRDLLAWIHHGGLEEAISRELEYGIKPLLDLDHVFAFGTSSGGTLALCLGFDVLRPVAGIFDMYGPCDFSNPFWTQRLEHLAAKLPRLSDDFINQVFDEHPVPITGGVSLEGQAQGPPNFDDPRQAFAFTQIAHGKVLDAIFPSKQWDKVDPLYNIDELFPPTFIVHGGSDTMVFIEVSKNLLFALRDRGIRCGMREVPGEDHTFAARMKVGSRTWELQREGFDFLQSLIQ
jgi:acetyl esterase/lipase